MLEHPKAFATVDNDSDNAQDITMGNQQERLEEADLHWFAGIFDGEGCLSIGRAKYYYLMPRACLTNTSEILIDKAKTILNKVGIPYGVDSCSNRSKLSNKTVHQININTLPNTKKFLDVFEPYLRVKTAEAKIIRAYIESRLSEHAHNEPYFDVECFIRLRELHGYQLRESSESIRQGFRKRRHDVLRSQTERLRRRQK